MNLDVRQVQAEVAAGTVKYDGAQAAACLDAVADATRDCSRSKAPTHGLPACAAVFTGMVADGGACFGATECASQRCDVMACTAACCPGTCAASTPSGVPLGGACTGAFTCAAGGFCDGSTMPFHCVPSLPAGSRCAAEDSCAAGLGCLPSTADPASPFACAAFAAEGAPCTGEDTCDLTTDFCDPATSTCKPRLAPGSACDPTVVSCLGYASCDKATGKCIALGRLGDPCPVAFGDGCLSDLECGTDDVCQLPTPDPICP
ncbi:MAG TPA: hypothetical protein VHL80_19535 [Polyangia bacterium]|nr:hypothetical protein [Polyangia bacterium]